MSDTSNIVGIKALHGGVISLEQRVEILEELLLVKSPADLPSPAVIEPELKSNREFESVNSEIDSVKNVIDEIETDLIDVKDSIEELERNGVMSEEQMTDKIKYWLQRFLRNALNLEVSFDDKGQT